MIQQNFYQFEPTLPRTIKSKAKFTKAYTGALNAVEQAKLHWRALLATPEIADRCNDIDAALDNKETILAFYTKKIEDVDALPLPPTEKAKMLREWQSAKDDAETHLTQLEYAIDGMQCGMIHYDLGDPESLSIDEKDLKEFAEIVSTIIIPDEARELYSKFLAAINAINDFHDYQQEKGLNQRDFISVISHIHSAEEFASNWVKGTWKKYI